MSKTTMIQNNFFLGGPAQAQMFANSPLTSVVPRNMTAEVKSKVGNLLQNFETGFMQGLSQGLMQGLQERMQGALSSPTCGCHHPEPTDSSHPAGSLKKDDNGVITTPGGYKIEATGQYEWKITDPNGKATTRVWGDPHVDATSGDGTEAHDFDFKRPTSFVLGDGTKIDVSVKPYNNMTVTSGLQITNGNDRVEISNIDQGKGKVGDITHDGFQHVNDFGKNDVFVMGKDASQWTSQGKEIVGSENGGDSFKLGADVKPTLTGPLAQTPGADPKGGGVNPAANNWAQKILSDVAQLLKDIMPAVSNRPQFPGQNPYVPGAGQQYNRDNHLRGLGDAFRQVGQMLQIMSQLMSLTQQIGRQYNG
jgi:hypothetical protein